MWTILCPFFCGLKNPPKTNPFVYVQNELTAEHLWVFRNKFSYVYIEISKIIGKGNLENFIGNDK